MTTENSTIQLSIKTKNKLASFGHKGETFEEIILRIIQEHEKEIFGPTTGEGAKRP